jgi:hypothetical protein
MGTGGHPQHFGEWVKRRGGQNYFTFKNKKEKQKQKQKQTNKKATKLLVA